MLKVIDPVRWETAKAIFSGLANPNDESTISEACEWVDVIVDSAIDRGWLAEVPDEPEPPTTDWRPISEAEGSEESLMVGGYLYGDWTWTWGPYKQAVRYGYTHYLPIPEPPAKEGE